ncbi:nucleotidyltransferase [candidate division KSB1 bacterium]|nr:nucleotidyltransferase [candidate division KSB1 bacterium]
MEKSFDVPLRAAITFLEKHNYRYAIIGGIALSQWGVVRATYDIDIKVLVPDTDYTRIRDLLKSTFPLPARKIIPENPLIISVMIENVIVDFLLAIPGYEELIIEHSIQRNIGGIPIWICSVEDLIIQKIVAGRGKDWDDVEALLIEQKNKLDEDYIENWLKQFADVLENIDLLIKYKNMLQKIRAISKKY